MTDHSLFEICIKGEIYNRLFGLLSHGLSSRIRNTASVGTLKSEIL